MVRGLWHALLAVLGACAFAGEARAVGPSGGGDLGEGRKIALDLWKHTEGPPRGQVTSLVVGDEGDEAAVANIVAAKKIEMAAAGLHHATVLEKQALDHTQQANVEEETAATAEKMAQVANNRVKITIKDTDKQIDKLRAEKNGLEIKLEEAKANLEMASSAEETPLKKKIQNLKNLLTINEDGLQRAILENSKASHQRRNTRIEERQSFETKQEAHLKVVMDAVKLRHAQQDVMHARYEALRSKGMKILAAAKGAKENAHKAYKESLANIKSAKGTLEVLTIGQAEKDAKARLKKYQEASVKSKEDWDKAGQKVNDAKAEVNKADLAWVKKVAYKDVMKSAKLGATAAKADEDFEKSVNERDKISKANIRELAQKDLKKANLASERAEASVEHAKYKIKADEQARKAADDEIKEQMAAAAALAKKQKEEEAEDKKTMTGVGKPA